MTATRRRLRLARPLDLRLTLGPLRRGHGDPTIRLDAGDCWRATRTPCGPATLHLRLAGPELACEAWGEGAEWAAEHVAELVGEEDDDGSYRPEHPLLRELARRLRGLRIGRTRAVLEAAVPTILEQKVAGAEAWAAWRRLVRWRGEPAPGPAATLGLRLPPGAPELLATPPWVFHRAGVEQRRAQTVRLAAQRARRLQETVAMAPDQARRRLSALPGMGPWSAAEVALVALGDPDAVSVGDYHLPHDVCWALAGEARGSEARMLELLEPYRGHRARVQRHLGAAGIAAPRFGPRMPLRDIARI